MSTLLVQYPINLENLNIFESADVVPIYNTCDISTDNGGSKSLGRRLKCKEKHFKAETRMSATSRQWMLFIITLALIRRIGMQNYE